MFSTLLVIFGNDRIHNVVLTLLSIVKLDVENYNVVSTLSTTVHIVDLMLFDVENFNIELKVHSQVSDNFWQLKVF